MPNDYLVITNNDHDQYITWCEMQPIWVDTLALACQYTDVDDALNDLVVLAENYNIHNTIIVNVIA